MADSCFNGFCIVASLPVKLLVNSTHAVQGAKLDIADSAAGHMSFDAFETSSKWISAMVAGLLSITSGIRQDDKVQLHRHVTRAFLIHRRSQENSQEEAKKGTSPCHKLAKLLRLLYVHVLGLA